MRTKTPTVWMLIAVGLFARHLDAQVTASTYQRAEQFLGQNVRTLVFHDQVAPQWLDGDRFWYRDRTPAGGEFILVDPGARTRGPAFDQARLAAALSVAADTAYATTRTQMSDELDRYLVETEDPRATGREALWDYYPYYGLRLNKDWKVDAKTE